MASIRQWCKELLLSFIASILFYTSIPLPWVEGLDFRRIARFVVVVGLIIGGILALLDLGISWLGVPVFTRTVIIICFWVALTGGLHLDGAMDTADGLAVVNPERRLEVMMDSATGAFGAMTAVALLLIKTAALSDMTESLRWLGIMSACGWGRWGQMLAIFRYPYLKATGKGAIHKEAIASWWNLLPSFILLLGMSGLYVFFHPQKIIVGVVVVFSGSAIAFLVGSWFNHKLGGHTGDTYGAVVEWTEALLLCVMTTF
ncbi:adenosylcobinamide-GDP ribazoletransferase [Calothrix sp. PCC 6303]|uniref:adenosylcobinamide-GDP ribazoletransferase n=1 Tax=Calothrix sp. PCC 6303 TaxID=1170562 RepID=UPI0002A04A23|nr:adenosylcobinamide-GDP ribazoletransferase [Calothrix sp. PCC 6303]AFZ02649.1 cobalamin-5'-phosphate synthase [Calothrix sp. PCC 6303]